MLWHATEACRCLLHCIRMQQSLLTEWTTHVIMIDDAPQSCSPNEFNALIVETCWTRAPVFVSRSSVLCCLLYVFGMAKSQAVSWAHFHMARTNRVKPMSLGFSSPRISRCFMMAMNSLLLSSPFPGAGRQMRGIRRRDERKMMRGYDFNLFFSSTGTIGRL